MESTCCFKVLRKGCDELGFSKATAKELFRVLIIKSLTEESTHYIVSSHLQHLLDWLLLNTEERDTVESVIGPIQNTTSMPASPLKRRIDLKLATMNALSQYGWEPNISLWEEDEADSPLGRIFSAQLTELATGESSRIYYTADHGHDAVLEVDATKFAFNDADKWRLDQLSGKKHTQQKSQQDTAARIQVSVKTYCGKTYSISASPASTVYSLKEAIEKVDGHRPIEQRLIYMGKALMDSTSLQEYRITEGAIIHVCWALRGC